MKIIKEYNAEGYNRPTVRVTYDEITGIYDVERVYFDDWLRMYSDTRKEQTLRRADALYRKFMCE